MTEREKLIELLYSIRDRRDIIDDEYIDDIADELLANGVRLQVLCKDCDFSSLWAGDGIDKQGKCFFLIGENQYVIPDHYCSCGTRREDTGNS